MKIDAVSANFIYFNYQKSFLILQEQFQAFYIILTMNYFNTKQLILIKN